MEFDTILSLFTTVFTTVTFGYGDTILSVVGGAALIAAGVSKPGSQYKTKAGKIFGTVINLLGANFGKAANKE